MCVSIGLFWQVLVGAAIVARDSKFVVVALPQPAIVLFGKFSSAAFIEATRTLWQVPI